MGGGEFCPGRSPGQQVGQDRDSSVLINGPDPPFAPGWEVLPGLEYAHPVAQCGGGGLCWGVWMVLAHYGLAAQIMKYAEQRIPTLNEYCVVCDEQHVFQNGSMLKVQRPPGQPPLEHVCGGAGHQEGPWGRVEAGQVLMSFGLAGTGSAPRCPFVLLGAAKGGALAAGGFTNLPQ